MKTLTAAAAALVILSLSPAWGQTDGNKTIDMMLAAYSQRAYSTQPVTDDQIDRIVKCGIKAPSARNRQPWHFTVVKDAALGKKVITNLTDGNIVIVVSGTDTPEASIEFDCALATESMFIAAEALGLGARIYTGPVKNANDTLKEPLGIPSGFRIIALLRVGNLDRSVDAASAATKRKDAAEIVNTK